MERTSKGSGFKLRSGNMTSFKMMGAKKPSALKKEEGTKKGDPLSVANTLKAEKEVDELRKAKGRDRLVQLEKRYNTTFVKDEDGVFRNPDGLSPSELEAKRLKPSVADEFKSSPTKLKLDYKSMTKAQVRDAVIKHNRKGPKTAMSMAQAMRMWNKAQERKGKDLKKFSDLEKFDDDRG